jgi:phasin
MKSPTDFEVPEAVRQLAEKNVEQARGAYDQFMEMARKAQETINQSSGVAAESAREVQSKALGFAEQNMEAGFQFFAELSKARDLKEYMEIQQRHTEKSMKAYSEQAQELGKLVAEVTEKAKPKA